MRIIIVGGVAAGASAAVRLRRLNEEAEIIVLEKGPYVSFSNCALPYRLSETVEKTEDLILMTPDKLHDQFNLDVRVNSMVTSIDNKQKLLTVETDKSEQELTYDKLILTPGTKPFIPQLEGIDEIPTYTLKTITDVEQIIEKLKTSKPKNLIVLGGGFIGIEAAENLKLAGYDVTLIEGNSQILSPFDYEMSYFAENELRDNGVNIIKGNKVVKFTKSSVFLDDEKEYVADAVIMAIGVKPNTDFIKSSTIELDEGGYIITNENYVTSDSDVYSGGDAIKVTNQLLNMKTTLALAGPANKQGRMIADHISAKKVINKGYIATNIIKVFDMTLASTGLNEKTVISNNIDFESVYAAPDDKVSIMPYVNPMMIKLIFNRNDGMVLGAQIVGKGNVDKRIDVIATAIKANMNVEDLLDLELAYAPSYGTGKDVINKVGYIAQNLLEEQYKQIKFIEMYNLVRTNAQIIDVRSEAEYNQLHVKGVKNIPLDKLRSNMSKLNKNEPIYVHCKSGQRSYNATMILQANGFDAYNIAGGFIYIELYEKMRMLEDVGRNNIIV